VIGAFSPLSSNWISPADVLIVTCVMLISLIIGTSTSSLFFEQELRINAKAKELKVNFNMLLFFTDLA
jgi:hypothetical protein